MSNEKQEPTMEQMLADLERACAYADGSVPDARNSILARFAELERERDAYSADAERIRAVVAEWQAHFLSSYREDRTTYREGKSDAADFILARVDAAIAQRGEKGS